MARKRRKQRINRIRIVTAAALGILLAAAVLIGVFRIRSVEIIGSERHSMEEIKNNLIYDFWTENTLYFSWKYRNSTEDTRTPYLESIQAKLLSPGKVRLIVKEKQLLGYVQYAGENVYFDKNGTTLEITQEVYGDVPLVSGISMEQPVLYQKIPIENTAQLSAMLKITDLLVKAKFIPDNVSFDENLNITLTVGGIMMKLGQNNCLEEKVANLVTIYQSIQGQSGTLNMEGFTGKENISFQAAGSEDAADVAGDETESSGDGTGDGTENGGDGTGDGAEAGGEGSQDGAEGGNEGSGDGAEGGNEGGGDGTGSGDNAGDGGESGEDTVSGETTGVSAFMVFDSSGTLRYDAHVVNGQVVDANGTPIDGCYVNENGNVMDAYWNEIDPATGQLAQ